MTYGVAFRGEVSRSFSVFEFVSAMVGGDELELVLRADVLQGARRTAMTLRADLIPNLLMLRI